MLPADGHEAGPDETGPDGPSFQWGCREDDAHKKGDSMTSRDQDALRFYQSRTVPQIIEIPTMTYLAISGHGDPNGAEFGLAVQALYAVSYAIRMSYRQPDPPSGYHTYKVSALEGIWDLLDITKPVSDKSNYAYDLMIRQPDFVTEDVFRRYVLETMRKKRDPVTLNQVKHIEYADGLSCQMLHVGPYDEEPASFKRMEEHCENLGYHRVSKRHKEIYLSDPRKTAPHKMRTILRFKVERDG